MLATALAALPFVLAQTDLGNSFCRCIDPWAELSFNLSTHDPGPATSAACRWRREGDNFCHNATYGSAGCQFYDLASSPECQRRVTATGPLPPHCFQQFCYVSGVFDPLRVIYSVPSQRLLRRSGADCVAYADRLWPPFLPQVDPNACQRNPVYRSVDFVNAKVFERPLSYSYGTCGYVSSFVQPPAQAIARVLEGSKLRIGFPGDSNAPFLMTTTSPGQAGAVPGTNKSGAYPLFIYSTFNESQIEWEALPISQRSYDFVGGNGSSYTVCTHEVGLGNIDMCWGPFWTTPERRRLTTFSGAIEVENFFLIVRRQGQGGSSFGSSIKQPFEIFSTGLWLLLVVVFGYAGVVLVHESGTYEHAWDEFVQSPVSLLKGVNAFNLKQVPGMSLKSSGQWLHYTVLGFIATILTTAYTAATTTRLVQAAASDVTSMNQAISNGYIFCVHEVIAPWVIERYPELQFRLVTGLEDPTELEKMDLGLCDGAIKDHHRKPLDHRPRRQFAPLRHEGWARRGSEPAQRPF